MHKFETLITAGISFSLNALDKANSEYVEQLQNSSSTPAVKGLQMIELQKTVLAIGMFSLFESILQQRLSCKKGFQRTKEILQETNQIQLLNRFNDFYLAINVLKHGKGLSYNKLVEKADSLPFQIKMKEEYHFDEGDVSEVLTYLKVDNDFVLNCADIIQKVSEGISVDI
jgi:hypothetical protein